MMIRFLDLNTHTSADWRRKRNYFLFLSFSYLIYFWVLFCFLMRLSTMLLLVYYCSSWKGTSFPVYSIKKTHKGRWSKVTDTQTILLKEGKWRQSLVYYSKYAQPRVAEARKIPRRPAPISISRGKLSRVAPIHSVFKFLLPDIGSFSLFST